jgi:hypothetical protein
MAGSEGEVAGDPSAYVPPWVDQPPLGPDYDPVTVRSRRWVLVAVLALFVAVVAWLFLLPVGTLALWDRQVERLDDSLEARPDLAAAAERRFPGAVTPHADGHGVTILLEPDGAATRVRDDLPALLSEIRTPRSDLGSLVDACLEGRRDLGDGTLVSVTCLHHDDGSIQVFVSASDRRPA